MIGSQHRQAIPTKLSLEQFEQFVLATSEPRQAWTRSNACVAHDFQLHPALLYTGCQWKALPIKMNAKGCPEIHYTRIYRALRRWQADGCIDRIFAGSVRKLHVDGRLDLSVIHGDGTTTAAKKGGDNLGYSGHKHLKGDKVVAFCDRTATSSRNSLPLRATATNRPCYVMLCPNSVRWHAPSAWTYAVQR